MQRHKASRGYATGNKRCHHCNLFIKWNGLLCPCYGYKLRTRRKVSKYKEKLREQKLMAQAEEVKNTVSYSDTPMVNSTIV